ncbi:MAG: DUF2461 domain-containing protein [Weeksellaceae bacterium]|nr:DUF2461 domain-containing protein [Weeksellaceae bacterium]
MANFLDFLSQLEKNNNREWFAAHKPKFEIAKKEADLIFDEVYEALSEVEVLQPLKKYRIYRDIRFSLDKTPYKNHFSAFVGRKKPEKRGGFYIHFEKDNCFIGGGFWGPEKDDLLRIRKAIDSSATLEILLEDKVLSNTFGNLYGDELKTAPKGFPKDHERIELLRKKQFLFIKKFDDHEIFEQDFPQKVVEAYQILLPFYNYMTEVLTTNENGESII